MKIRIFYENTTYRFRGWKKAVSLFVQLITSENLLPGDINIIISTDDFIRELNLKYLNHNYNTDVIAFDGNSGSIVNGDIYISKDTVKRNACNYKASLDNEMLRVMIHGLLHLSGYDDKTECEKENMHRIEDRWLNIFSKSENAI